MRVELRNNTYDEKRDVIVMNAVSMIVLFLSLFVTFFVYDQFEIEADEEDEKDWQPLTTEDMENQVVRST